MDKSLNIDQTQAIETDLRTKNEKLLAYYEKAGPDYEAWSKNFNMHFGYYRTGINPFNRESMLEEMNEQVLDRLKVDKEGSGTLVDFGCGLGATLRYAGTNYSNYDLKGITIVPWQVQQANSINAQSFKNSKIEIIEADYCHTPLKDNSADGIIAMESSCYATGDTKRDLLQEIYRVLKPGGRFVIADGFRKNSLPMNFLLKAAYHKLCTSWSLTELGNINSVTETLKQIGFRRIKSEDISMRVAPSVAHVPFTVISFLTNELLFGKEKMSRERWDNLKSPLLTMIIGSCQKHFGYYLVSGVK
ncbi:MAG: methyltransferase domain-containing protein [Bacteroidota bacterium]